MHDRNNQTAPYVARTESTVDHTPDTAGLPETAATPDAAPTHIGPYRVLRRLGSGGMGAVYLAEQPNPKRPVALKVIRPDRVSERMLARFRLESQILGWIRHPAVAQVFEAGELSTPDGPQPFYAMEYVEGRTLLRFAREQKLTDRQKLSLFATVCDGVEAAHRRGVIHRDLKPANIVVGADGGPKILDFGIARVAAADDVPKDETIAGEVMGTANYMSPEQAAGDPAEIDTRTDVYALGVILFELLTGKPPLDLTGTPFPAALRQIADAARPSLAGIDPRYRGDLGVIADTAVETDKAARYQSASALAADVRRYLSDEPILARPTGAWSRAVKFVRRNTLAAAAGGAVAAALVVGLGAAVYGLNAARVEAAKAKKSADEAKAAEEAATRELAERTFTNAQFLRQRGQYADSLAQYDRAVELGYPDPVRVRLAKLPALDGLGRYDTISREIADLKTQPVGGGNRAEVLFWRGKLAMAQGSNGEDGVALLREAVEAGLPPAKEAYVKGFLAETIPGVLDGLLKAVALDPSDLDAVGTATTMLLLSGRYDEAEQMAGRLATVQPNAFSSALAAASIAAVRGDQKKAGRILDACPTISPATARSAKQSLAAVASFAEPEAGWDMRFRRFFGRMMKMYLAQSSQNAFLGASQDNDPSMSRILSLPCFRGMNPFSQASLAEMAAGKTATADTADKAYAIFPCGVTIYSQGSKHWQRKDYARAADFYRRAADTPSFIPIRQVALFDLVQVLQEGWTEADTTWNDLDREQQFRDVLRELAGMGPLPNDPECDIVAVYAAFYGEPALAQILAGELLRSAPGSPRGVRIRMHVAISEQNYPAAYELSSRLTKLDPSYKTGEKHRDRAAKRLQDWLLNHPELTPKP